MKQCITRACSHAMARPASQTLTAFASQNMAFRGTFPCLTRSTAARYPWATRRRSYVASKERDPEEERHAEKSYTRPARDLDNTISKEEMSHFDREVAEDTKAKQIRTPWHREGADTPPVSQARSAGAMTKGN